MLDPMHSTRLYEATSETAEAQRLLARCSVDGYPFTRWWPILRFANLVVEDLVKTHQRDIHDADSRRKGSPGTTSAVTPDF